MVLKPKPAASIVAIVFGVLFLMLIRWVSSLPLEGEAMRLCRAGFGVCGLSLLSFGIGFLLLRSKRAIHIDESGIKMLVPNRFLSVLQRVEPRLLKREDIEMISKNESLAGRLIEIAMKDGEKILIEGRDYCSLNKFISHCKNHGLATAD